MAISYWTVVLSLVAASTKLSKDPARASITSCVAGSVTNQVSHSADWFIQGTRALVVDAPGVCNQVGLLPFGPGFLGRITSFLSVRFFLVTAQLEHRGGGVHGSLMSRMGSSAHFTFFQDEVRNVCRIFVEEEHI